ncbi:hypothetical protein D3C78_1663680 [compost metagenome]
MQLVRQQARDFHLGTGHSATEDAQLLLAIQAEQGAFGKEGQGARILGHLQQAVGRVLGQVATDRLDLGRHLHIEEAPRCGLELEGVQAVQRFDAGDMRQL